jgi:hypothetical protein
MLCDNPVQVIIPFDEKADVKDVEKHVTDTVVKVISKVSQFSKVKHVTDTVVKVISKVSQFT